MATANPIKQPRPRRRARIWLFAALSIIGLIALFWAPISGFARTGSAYGARVACSCRFVGGRSLGDCRKDFEAGMELVSLSEDVEDKSVTARTALGWPQTATYREGQGCVLEQWAD
jgi:hypothetical protein